MKLNQIVGITKILSDRKVPDDVEKFLNDEYYSESKKGHLNLLEMPLDYLVRAFNKTLKKLNEKEPLKKYKVTLSVDEAYSIILEAKGPQEAEEMALNIMNEQDPPYYDFKIEDGQGVSIEDTEEIK